jgi:hypothetical protein
MKNIKVGDRVRFTFENKVFAKLLGKVGTVTSYSTHGWASDESKHSVIVDWDDNSPPMVGGVNLVDKV